MLLGSFTMLMAEPYSQNGQYGQYQSGAGSAGTSQSSDMDSGRYTSPQFNSMDSEHYNSTQSRGMDSGSYNSSQYRGLQAERSSSSQSSGMDSGRYNSSQSGRMNSDSYNSSQPQGVQSERSGSSLDSDRYNSSQPRGMDSRSNNSSQSSGMDSGRYNSSHSRGMESGRYVLANSSEYGNSSSRSDNMDSDYQSDKSNEEQELTSETSSLDKDQAVSKNVYENLYGYISDGNQNISFELNDGVVTLTGYVNTQKDKDKIERDIKRVDGVKQVINNIKVTDTKKLAYYQPKTADNSTATKSSIKSKDYAALDNDKKINAQIREKLDNRDFTDVAIITANGVVTLGGFVSNADEFVPFVFEIEKIEGVKKVNNKVSAKK